uniref:Mitochondrial import inner membrane translocase subunit Tim10 B n=1 Tax=Chelydra serpentina TaxID=8475 RepID=A0A8C3XP03_CHESE
MAGGQAVELWAGMGICSPWSRVARDSRGLSLQEACLDGCAGKLVHSNHRLMGAYMQLMPSIVQRRISDYEAAAAQAVPGSGPKEVPAACEGALLRAR